jgi:hypothetical protein
MTGPTQPGTTSAERIAEEFHATYERLAPQYGYKTRKGSAKPWAEVPSANKKLMVAVVADLLKRSEIADANPPGFGPRPTTPNPGKRQA